ncbi:hypothetical protein P4E94_19140 [Pontiellaceae bacterium B12219]|nr:hypothetical protein [Pontiellaceae bacterium B12219]
MNLESYKTSQTLVTIKREKIDGNKIQGFILAYSDELILIQYVYDFNLDGLMVLRISDITSLESTKTDVFQTQILKDEDLYSKITFSSKYDVQSWHSVLSTLGKEYEYIIIEDEDPEFPIFMLGALKKIGNESVSILEFTGTARWQTELSQMCFENISSFQVGNNYSNIYRRYFERNSIAPPDIK